MENESQDGRGNRVTKRGSAAFESTREGRGTPRLPRVVETRAPEAPSRVKCARVTGHGARAGANRGPRAAVGCGVPFCACHPQRPPLTTGTPDGNPRDGPHSPARPRPAGGAGPLGRLWTGTRHSPLPWGHRCHLPAGRRMRRSRAGGPGSRRGLSALSPIRRRLGAVSVAVAAPPGGLGVGEPSPRRNAMSW